MDNSEVYIVAELSANHEQNLELAKRTIEAMAKSGANAVKVQTFIPDSMTLDSNLSWFQTRKDSLWAGQKLYDLYKRSSLPYNWHREMKITANNLGLDFFSTPFDLQAVDFLEDLGVPYYKIASLEITDIPLIEYTASKGKPIFLSTGVATKEDISLAVKTCRNAGNDEITLLKCTSAYPTPMSEVNLNLLPRLKHDFNVNVGLSDHTLGIEVPIAAVVLGISVIEKHFILDKKNSKSVDKEFSLDAQEFHAMVKAVRNTEKAIGNATYQLTNKAEMAKASARSLFAIHKIQKGEQLTKKNIGVLRPGLGLHPRYYYQILGKTARTNINKGTPLSFDLFE